MSKGKQHYDELPGNAVGSAANYQKYIMSFGEALLRLDSAFEKNREPGTLLLRVSFKSPGLHGTEWFVVVTALQDGVPKVAFHAGDSLSEAVKGLCNRYVYGKLKWKDDEYAIEKGNEAGES